MKLQGIRRGPGPRRREMVAFLLEQRGLKPSDLWPVIGSKGRVSEILSGKRAWARGRRKSSRSSFACGRICFSEPERGDHGVFAGGQLHTPRDGGVPRGTVRSEPDGLWALRWAVGGGMATWPHGAHAEAGWYILSRRDETN